MSRYHVERLDGTSFEQADPTFQDNHPRYHVCDERGRTVRIFTSGRGRYEHGNGNRPYQGAAEWAQQEADRLTALHACTVQLHDRHAAIVPPPPAPEDRPESADPGDPDGDDSRADEERGRYYTGSETWKP